MPSGQLSLTIWQTRVCNALKLPFCRRWKSSGVIYDLFPGLLASLVAKVPTLRLLCQILSSSRHTLSATSHNSRQVLVCWIHQKGANPFECRSASFPWHFTASKHWKNSHSHSFDANNTCVLGRIHNDLLHNFCQKSVLHSEWHPALWELPF